MMRIVVSLAARKEVRDRNAQRVGNSVFGFAYGSTAQNVCDGFRRKARFTLKSGDRAMLYAYFSFDLLAMPAHKPITRKPDGASAIPDDTAANPKGQAAEKDVAFGKRLKSALNRAGQSEKWLATELGRGKTTVNDWIAGSSPRASDLFYAAELLDVSPEWLVKGPGTDIADAPGPYSRLVMLPRFDLSGFSDGQWPEPIDHVSLPADWIARITRGADSVWLAEMPSDAMPSLAREGDTLILQNAAPPAMDGRTYVFLIRGDIVIRKIYIRPEGLILRSDDPDGGAIIVTPDQTKLVTPIARVLGAIALRAV